MKTRTIKIIIGCILCFLFAPILGGIIHVFANSPFSEGFLLGLVANSILIVLIGFTLLILWLFGRFD